MPGMMFVVHGGVGVLHYNGGDGGLHYGGAIYYGGGGLWCVTLWGR